jgi:hypothetical protein
MQCPLLLFTWSIVHRRGTAWHHTHGGVPARTVHLWPMVVSAAVRKIVRVSVTCFFFGIEALVHYNIGECHHAHVATTMHALHDGCMAIASRAHLGSKHPTALGCCVATWLGPLRVRAAVPFDHHFLTRSLQKFACGTQYEQSCVWPGLLPLMRSVRFASGPYMHQSKFPPRFPPSAREWYSYGHVYPLPWAASVQSY